MRLKTIDPDAIVEPVRANHGAALIPAAHDDAAAPPPPRAACATAESSAIAELCPPNPLNSVEALERILNGIVQPVIVKDRAHRFLFLNDAACALIGLPREELIGRSDHDFLPKEQADSFWAVDDEVFSTGEHRRVEEHITAPDGALRTLLTHKRLITLPTCDGEETFLVAVIADITQLRKTEAALRESEEHYRHSVELSPQIPWTADAQGNILEVASRWIQLTGMSREQALGQGWTKALHPEDVAPATKRWSEAVATGKPMEAEYRLRLADGTWRWFRARAATRRNDRGEIVRWYGTVEDIHDRKLAEETLRWAAYHDDLTGLPNRRLFQERLQQALADQGGMQRRVGLLVMDVDDFKVINDIFGHDAGDALLRQIGQRLRSAVRAGDTVARLGGDEFAVILRDVAGDGDVRAIAQSIQAMLHEPLSDAGRVRECRTSMGGAISMTRGAAPEELLKQADLALYRCKAERARTFELFQPLMREEAQKAASALEMARKAVTSEWILPFYQPKVSLNSGKVTGFEALLRWHHPRNGPQLPNTIAPAFDDTELGIAIGRRMLSRVVGDIGAWLDAGFDFCRIAINASSAEFRHGDYAERVLECLHQAGVPPDRLEIEVTESVFLGRNTQNVDRALRTLSAAGVTIALDDFGTGYASLSHLKQFPVDAIKIDCSFVADLESDAGAAAITGAVLNLGHSLGIKVVAEGVETAAQASLLRRQGCDLAQGFCFGRPMPARDVPRFVPVLPRNA